MMSLFGSHAAKRDLHCVTCLCWTVAGRFYCGGGRAAYFAVVSENDFVRRPRRHALLLLFQVVLLLFGLTTEKVQCRH